MSDHYYDAEGNEVSLDQLCKLEELTEERDSLSSKLEKCEAERAKYERWFYEKFGQAFEAEEDLDALLEANRGLQAKLDRYRTALKAVVDACDLPDADYTAVERAALRKAREALSDE